MQNVIEYKQSERRRQQKLAYYYRKYKEIRRQRTFKGRFCRLCEIRLDGQWGAKGTVWYCRDCRDRGLAEKHSNNLYNRRRRFLRKHEPKINSKINVSERKSASQDN